MSEYKSKVNIKKLSIILSASIFVTITLEIVINSYVEKYFFGSILIPVVVIWAIVGIIEFVTREDREERNRPKAAKVIQVDMEPQEKKIEENDEDYY